MRWSAEVRAASILLALATLGAGVRACRVPGAQHAPGAVWTGGAAARPGQEQVARDAARLARPLAAGERVDVNQAGAADLARLPRVGPALAAGIVREREAAGPFPDLAALDARVRGVGPALRAAIAPHVTFGGRLPGAGDAAGAARDERVAVNRADAAALEALPGVGPVLAAAIVAERERGGAFRSPEDLARVRGIGPALVARLKGRILLP